MNPRVTAVASVENHALLLNFNNCGQRRLDVSPYLAYAVFERLREHGFFALAQADHGTVSWPGGDRPGSGFGVSGQPARWPSGSGLSAAPLAWH